jgi:hypothetical protein
MLVRNMQTYLRRYSMTTVEKLKNRLQSLKEQHALEHQRCEAAEAEKVQEKYLTEMKKKKLAIKDEIAIIEKQIEEM